MISVIFNRDDLNKIPNKKQILSEVGPIFDAVYENSWLQDENVCNIISSIDNIDINKNTGLFFHPILGNLDYNKLSNGTKNLLIILKCKDLYEEYIFDATKMGENCFTLLQQIGYNNNFMIYYGYSAELDDKMMSLCPIYNPILNEYYNTNEELFIAYIKNRKQDNEGYRKYKDYYKWGLEPPMDK